MDPVFLVVITDTAIQSRRRKDQDKVLGHADTVDQLLVESPGIQLVNVDKDGEAAQLQVNLEEATRNEKNSRRS